MRSLHAVVMGVICLAFVAAGCGGAIPSSDGGPAMLKLMATEHGRFLADAQGHTLYLFLKDEGGESYCTGACAAVWPPLETSSMPHASAGVSAGAVGTIKRGDGELQVTYHGHPLYYYAADASTSGYTKGEAVAQFGAPWYVVRANGQPLELQGSSTGSNSNNGGSGSNSGSSGGGGGWG
jgi:predicted lipoprotein with Yx(FWY)xxD motif